MLTTTRIHPPWSLTDLFDDGQWCPICHGRAFTHTEGAGLTCDQCAAVFELRQTAGDPGVVIDCWGNPQGKYAATTTGIHGTIYYFWQVVKECEEGLADRKRWCSHSGKYGLSYHADDPLLFAEVYHYESYYTARQMAHDRWRKTPTGKRLSAELAAAKPPPSEQPTEVVVQARYALIQHPAEQRAAWDAYYEVLRRWQASLWEYERLHTDEIEAELRQRKRPEGLYFAEQCEQTWPADGYWLHRCLPKIGEAPQVQHPFYTRKGAPASDPAPLRQHLTAACAALAEASTRLAPDPVVDRWLALQRTAQTYLVEEAP